jgi:hypothetical protein
MYNLHSSSPVYLPFALSSVCAPIVSRTLDLSALRTASSALPQGTPQSLRHARMQAVVRRARTATAGQALVVPMKRVASVTKRASRFDAPVASKLM